MNPIQRLNERLGAELGRNPHGGGIYEWHRADTLLRPVFTGGYDYTPSGDDGLIVIPQPVYEARPVMPELGRRWALCLWSFTPEHEWQLLFGPRAEWPKRGYYTPTNVVLDNDQEPDLDVTQTLIGMVRNERARTYADLMAEGDGIVEALEKFDDQQRDDTIGDALPAFGNWKPGARCGGVSLPSPEFAQNIEHAFPKEQHV